MAQQSEFPAWNHSNPFLSVRLLFSEPHWVDAARRSATGSGWIKAMAGDQIYLDQRASVQQWAETIYNHLYSRVMPLTTDTTQQWPDTATEFLRAWVNQGFRENETDPFNPAERIPPPHPRPVEIRTRKDIRSLTPDELNHYRARLDLMHVADPSPDSPWQKLAYLHTNWCLHYQEAFLFWHRAYLMYLEDRLGMAIPYWNWMAVDASVDGSPNAGIPQAFKDLTYKHPVSGDERANPLRFAAAKDGRSKACESPAGKNSLSDADCRWVQRNPLLYTSGDDHRAEREKLIRMVRIFQDQVVLDATRNAMALGITPESNCALTLFVRNITSGKTLTPSEYLALPGFEGQLVWSRRGMRTPSVLQEATELKSETGGSCCHSAANIQLCNIGKNEEKQ